MTRNLLVDLIAVMNHELAPECLNAHGPTVDVEQVVETRDRLLDRLAEEDLRERAA